MRCRDGISVDAHFFVPLYVRPHLMSNKSVLTSKLLAMFPYLSNGNSRCFSSKNTTLWSPPTAVFPHHSVPG